MSKEFLKESGVIVKICDYITKYSLYVLVFLMPIFFLPWTVDVLDFNKQALLVATSFIALFAWMLKALVVGKFSIRINRVHIIVLVLLLTYVVSTIFSVMRYGSIWGWPNSSSDNLLSVIGLCIVYFLVSSVFTKKEILTSVVLIGWSTLIVGIFALLQLFGLHILPFNFAKQISFNTIGPVGSLELFLAVLLPLCIIFLITSKGWLKLLFLTNIVLIFATVVLTSYAFVWWVLLIGCALVMIFGVIKRNIFSGRWMFLPMFFLMISLFFIVLQPQIKFMPKIPGEVYISHSSSLGIDVKTLKNFPLFGSGPGSFSYDFAKYKDTIFNNGYLWNINFSVASSKILTHVATNGILGILAWLALMIATVFYGIKYLVFSKLKEGDSHETLLVMAVVVGIIAQSVAFFLYNSNLTLDFIYFFFIAILVALISKESKTYTLESSSLLSLSVTFVFTLVFIFGLGFLLLDGQRYIADVQYNRALALLQKGDVANGLPALESAVSMNPGLDLYFNQLSQTYLASIQTELQNTKLTDEQKTQRVQALIANAINTSKLSTEISPKNVNNWSVRANIYQNLIGLVPDAHTWAISSYDEAQKLDPNNPYFLLQEGMVYYQNKDYKNAQVNLEQAVNLKADYSDALYFLGLTYEALGNTGKAVTTLSKLLPIVSKEQASAIQTMIDNINAGRPSIADPQAPAPVVEPIDEKEK